MTNIPNQYVTFLKEYQKLLERGIKNIFAKSIIANFIWVDDILCLINLKEAESCVPYLFSEDQQNKNKIFTINKPQKPNIEIPETFTDTIRFNEAKNMFESLKEEKDLVHFKNSEVGQIESEKLQNYLKHKTIYSKLFRAYTDIKNDSTTEIVLSIGLIQHNHNTNKDKLSITNQHLFHFPLKIDINKQNDIYITFSETEKPYSDFAFLNNLPIEKEFLNKIVKSFDAKIDQNGSDYIFDSHFKDLISDELQKISEYSFFNYSVLKPEKEEGKIDYFSISFAPSINIKPKKPRFFEKLADKIIENNNINKNEIPLFNLLIRNPENKYHNSYPKSNYFIDELFECHKKICKNLTGIGDFSVFFPLPYNNEQKQVYENYLKNRLTVVTGPPGTGKSHTIVNILCTLLAQGKRVLVTAQTDKALESLLNKIPENFDSLVFTKIQLENKKERFSLEKSINNIIEILTDSFSLAIEDKIRKLENYKGEYVKLKTDIENILTNEYAHFSLNDSFSDLRNYQILEKLQSKNVEEWRWIKDEVNESIINDFENIRQAFMDYAENFNFSNQFHDLNKNTILPLYKELNDFDFEKYIKNKKEIKNLRKILAVNDLSFEEILAIDLNQIVEASKEVSNSDIVVKKMQQFVELFEQIQPIKILENTIVSNLSYEDIITNRTKYLLDIETYLSFIEDGKQEVGWFALLKSEYKKVKYIETIVLNGVNCKTRKTITALKDYIKLMSQFEKSFTLFKKHGYVFEIDNHSDVNEKISLSNKLYNKAQRNKAIITTIEYNTHWKAFSEKYNIDKYEVEQIHSKASSLQRDFKSLQSLITDFEKQSVQINALNQKILYAHLNNYLADDLPLESIENIDNFLRLKAELQKISIVIQKEIKFNQASEYLKNTLPNTHNNLGQYIDLKYITKENFEFSFADNYLKNNTSIDIQTTKENLSKINEAIYDLKCEILFDLAKDNFRRKFNDMEINDFKNLLAEYNYYFNQGNRGVRDKIKFQISARKKSAEISKKLSCWIMNFNEVLNSVDDEPEIFDCIIVDEASQLDFNSLLLGYYAKSIIIVGDDKQTSPTHLTGADGDSFDEIKNSNLSYLGQDIIQIKPDNSLFNLAKMIAGTADLMLKEHFRCVPEIIEFSKKEFYNHELIPLKRINTDRLKPKESIFIENACIENKMVYNEIEAIKKHLIRMLGESQYQNKTIGVVSLGYMPHTELLKNIKEDLYSHFSKDKIEKEHNLIIEDAPKFQGDERDVMLVSLGTALDLEGKKPDAIIKEEALLRKINVALSRAKEQMILFHGVKSENLKNNDFRNKILSFFYDQTKPIPQFILPENTQQRDKYNRPKPFDSWFEYDIAEQLIKHGFSYLQPQYSVKKDERHSQKEKFVNFRLDIVVFNNDKSVAIECDGDPYHSSFEDVAYDIERQEFLERVGWKVYRILYSAFKRNPTEEIHKMVDFINRHTKKNTFNSPQTLIEIERKEEEDIDSISSDFEDDIPNLFSNPLSKIEIEPKKDIKEDKILRYFNLRDDGTYKLEMNENSDSQYSIPIKESQRNGYLLQCYNNGYINKVYVKTLLNKQLNRQYANGKNPEATLIYLKIIEDDTIFGIRYKINGDIIFKAHDTQKISNREQLHLQGYKVMYSSFEEIEYKILPKIIIEDIKKLVFDSFTTVGKPVTNNYYKLEWKIIKRFMQNLYSQSFD